MPTVSPGHVYDDNTPPPAGRPMVVVNHLHHRLLWTGKRWCDPTTGLGLHTSEAWPPDPFLYGCGPWHEVVSR